MAHLIGVCSGENHKFQRRQLPLNVDDSCTTMVIQLGEKYFERDVPCNGNMDRGLERFCQRFSLLSKNEITAALMVDFREVYDLLTKVTPCVGCRRSVERLFEQLVKSQNPSLDPLVVKSDGLLSINGKFLHDAASICALFCIHGNKVNAVVDSIPRSKKNKRCNIHSLDGHKSRSSGSWLDTWDVMAMECKDEILLIDADSLLDTLTSHLKKHRFCAECKSKVMHAYSILVGDVDSTSDKTYCQALYDGLRCCRKERHVHVPCSLDYIAELISRAEPELAGSHRELHAKTLDVAQEEVLTCLGLCIYDRLSRIGQKMRAEEQTWQLLFYISVDAIRNSLETALERKEGISKLELTCEELMKEEQVKETRKQQKRLKKKLKKKEAKQRSQPCDEGYSTVTQKCKCGDVSRGLHSRKQCSSRSATDHKLPISSDASPRSCSGRTVLDGSVVQRSSDAGYSSDSCDNCSYPSSNGSDIVCSKCVTNSTDVCTHCTHRELVECRGCDKSTSAHQNPGQPRPSRNDHDTKDKSKSQRKPPDVSQSQSDGHSGQQYRMTYSLEDMLEEPGVSDEEAISDEDIRRFRENRQLVSDERQRLRQRLKKRFENLQIHGHRCLTCGSAITGQHSCSLPPKNNPPKRP